MCRPPVPGMLFLVLMHQPRRNPRRRLWGPERTGAVRRALTDTLGLEPAFHSSLLGSSRQAAVRSGTSRQYRVHYVLMGLTDALAVLVALLLAYQLRFDELVPGLDFWLLLGTVAPITRWST
jgi:hypothetical protein